MSRYQQTESAPGNSYTPSSICGHCAGVTSHETWCITRNLFVRYAFAIVLDGRQLTLGDELILHALGVEWNAAGKQR
jgi:hypothetical protein